MPNTTNFNWATPADTDLVKDGAAAIRTLGNSIDSSFVDLKGGTTGQVLTKASNTDLDFSFVTPNVGDITEVQAGVGISIASGTGPIPIVTNSSTDLITTAGDLLYGTAADTVARLGIGTAGRVLKVNSGATAPEWAVDPTTDVVTTAGDLIYGTGADAVTRLGIGTAGQVLKVNSGATAPEWGAASAGMTFISKTSWSAAASHTVDDVFTSTYTNYMIVIENWIGSAFGNDPELQLRYGSSTETAAYYGSSFGTAYNSATLRHIGTSNAAEFKFYDMVGENNGSFIVMNIERVGTGSSIMGIWSGHGFCDPNGEQYKFGGIATTTRNYTGFVLKVSTGTSSGNVTVYGLAKA